MVVAVALLLPGLVSDWLPAATVAVLEIVADGALPRYPEGTFTWIAIVAVAPGSMSPSGHVRVPATFVHAGVVFSSVTPAGSTSVAVTAYAVFGPPLVTLSV